MTVLHDRAKQINTSSNSKWRCIQLKNPESRARDSLC